MKLKSRFWLWLYKAAGKRLRDEEVLGYWDDHWNRIYMNTLYQLWNEDPNLAVYIHHGIRPSRERPVRAEVRDMR